MRPHYPLSSKREVPSDIPRPDYADDGFPTSEAESRGSHKIQVLTKEEQTKARKVCKLSREILDIACKSAKAGMTTDDIDAIVHEETIKRKAYPSPLNYHGFPKSVCTSVNEVICHGIPDKYVLKDGDLLNIDVTAYFDGYHGDMNETIFIGQPSEATEHLVRTTHECMMKAIDMCRPGALYRDLGGVIQKHATANNLSVVRSYCGHGVHHLFHTTPNIPHYAKNKAIGVMKAGHIFTIEPMINEGVWNDVTWPDNWTSVTRDGKKSAQFEHCLLITENGVEILSQTHDKLPHFQRQLKELKAAKEAKSE
ncbi:methionine aminopeptidase 1 [Sphaeroforma arctica JP610]|uniref:Methionine aminopeptidase n=1 Tax=Sphaeroforma arctica JP610 TaxID=667725 RepID=A0A0L0FWH3_9EUKA|nr:methionine aminopeptidase 1 [Sphaeroforma arctica JP610]KNC81180.1 methionine aminopeptidase 1 [Sphaeroforma arctica JP610]|eukprot:XP_014155082.1 methionine aminopeptidase 1 [Sphaeroforma arctica JP610]